jgi:hypothetical protein
MTGVDKNLSERSRKKTALEKIQRSVRHIRVSLPCIGRRGCGFGFHSLCRVMEELSREVHRRTFRWPGAAREIVKAYLKSEASKASGTISQVSLKELITKIAALTGHPRTACWRFARQSGVRSKRLYREWTKPEQQKLLDLIASHTLKEVTLLLRRSPTSVRSMLHRLHIRENAAVIHQSWAPRRCLSSTRQSM